MAKSALGALSVGRIAAPQRRRRRPQELAASTAASCERPLVAESAAAAAAMAARVGISPAATRRLVQKVGDDSLCDGGL